MKKRILVAFLAVLLVLSGCGKNYDKYENLSFSNIEKMFIENRELFSDIAEECFRKTGWGFEYKNGKVEIFDSYYGDEDEIEKLVLTDELNENLLKCFSVMEKTVELERNMKHFSLYVTGGDDVTFGFDDNACEYSICLCYSEEGMSDYPNSQEISDDWYLWSWGWV